MNIKYVYYNPSTFQVEAVFSSANLSTNANAESNGLRRAIVPDGLTVTRNHQLTEINEAGAHPIVVSRVDRTNPVQPVVSADVTRLIALHAALIADTITDSEIKEMLRLERRLPSHSH